MATPENILAAKRLIERYRSITPADILQALADASENLEATPTGEDAAYELTGFGTSGSCSLCAPLFNHKHWDSGPRCEDCLHFEPGWQLGRDFWGPKNKPCAFSDSSKPTYDAIENASSPEELILALRARADYLEERLGGKKGD